MVLCPTSKIVALRALLGVAWAEERRLLTIINSNETPAEEVLKALNDLHKLWSRTVLQLADIEDAIATSAPNHSPAKCNPEQIAILDDRQ